MHNYVDKLKRNYANYSRGTMLVLVLVLVRAGDVGSEYGHCVPDTVVGTIE